MTTVIAAIDADAAAAPTIRAGQILASVYGSELQVVHVGRPGERDMHLDVPVRFLHGDVRDEIVTAIGADDVVAAAIVARTDVGGRRPAGHVALDVAARVDNPLALVPPEAQLLLNGRPLRLLVPLDGTEDSALTVRAVLRRVAAAGAEIIVLHVFDADTVPEFLDRPEHDLPVWAHEFLSRFCHEPACHMQWRSGPASAGIADVAQRERVDGVVLGWSQVLDEGRAAVVQDVLASARVPVVLVPRIAAERALDAWADADSMPTQTSS